MSGQIVIVYTTLYRKGGAQFEQVAHTLCDEKKAEGNDVICQAVESKAELKQLFSAVDASGSKIREFHFIGHSGMYGPMYGSVAYPEQFSPFELKTLKIPFEFGAKAFFHCCRSARWFAPYFARVMQVKTYGYHWYTTFSKSNVRFKYPFLGSNNKGKLYCFGCPGKKSHGMLATFKKLTGLMKPEPLKEFLPTMTPVDSSYNQVADLYAKAFIDIKVREDEFKWLSKHLPKSKNIKVLDIGCGNGALLNELKEKISLGVGVDVSENLLKNAKLLNQKNDHIEFHKIKGPQLPFEDDAFDLVISFMSFRYLDWDPIMQEIERVLNTNGKLLIVDMVTAPIKRGELLFFLRSKLKNYLGRYTNKKFYENLKNLTSHPDWKQMLKYNPIRSEHEMKWYLESRFPERKMEIINVGLHSRIIAFDSLDMREIKNIKLSFP